MELHMKIDLPRTPMAGDPIATPSGTTTVGKEFSRFLVGQDRFATDAIDGNVYEIEIVARGNGTRGSQSWQSTRVVGRDEFASMHRTRTTD